MSRFKNRILARILTRFPKLVDRIAAKTEAIAVEGIPWAPVKKPLKVSRIAIVTTAGVHLRSQIPFNMKDSQGDPSYRELPSHTPKEDYIITHDYYDHTDADRDINIVYPIDRLKEMKEEGLIGDVAEKNYGFMGHIEGPHIDTLVRRTAPEVARKLKNEGVDIALLTPG